MFKNIFSTAAVFIASVIVWTQPVFADDENAKPDWVLQFFVIIVFLGLALAILLRPSKRSDTAFTTAELHKMKEDAMNAMKGHK